MIVNELVVEWINNKVSEDPEFWEEYSPKIGNITIEGYDVNNNLIFVNYNREGTLFIRTFNFENIVKNVVTYEKAKELLKNIEDNSESINPTEISESLKILETLIFSWINDRVNKDPTFWEEYKPAEGDWLSFYDSNYKNEKLWIVVYKAKDKPENDAAGNKKLHRTFELKDIFES